MPHIIPMRWNTFPKSVLFGAVVAAAFTPFVLFAANYYNPTSAGLFYLAVAVSIYVLGLAEKRNSQAAVFCAIATLPLVVMCETLTDAGVGLTVVLAIARSGIVYRRPWGRAIFVELGISGAALTAAYLVASPGYLGVSLGVWAWFVAQSAYFLVGGTRAERDAAPSPDPFESAVARATELMDKA